MLGAFDSAPYDFGSQFVGFVIADRGTKAVDRLFRNPPTTEEQIVDPVATRTDEAAKRVPAPQLAPGEKRDGAADDFGAFSLYLMLASRLDRATALAAATGWGGDRYQAFTKTDGTECVHLAFRGDTPSDTREIASALTEWTAQVAPGGASVARGGGVVDLTACDVGGTSGPTQQSIDDAGQLLYDRNDLTALLIDQGAAARVARCAAGRMALDPEVTALVWNEELGDAEQSLVQERVTQYESLVQERVTQYGGECGG